MDFYIEEEFTLSNYCPHCEEFYSFVGPSISYFVEHLGINTIMCKKCGSCKSINIGYRDFDFIKKELTQYGYSYFALDDSFDL